jgi:hypothetical protein
MILASDFFFVSWLSRSFGSFSFVVIVMFSFVFVVPDD